MSSTILNHLQRAKARSQAIAEVCLLTSMMRDLRERKHMSQRSRMLHTSALHLVIHPAFWQALRLARLFVVGRLLKLTSSSCTAIQPAPQH